MRFESEEEVHQYVLQMAEKLEPRDLGVPYVMVPTLNAGDVIGFEMPMAQIRVKVLDPIYLNVVLVKLRYFKGFAKYHGALDEVTRAYHPMALIPRFGHPGDSGTYLDISPTTAITINDQPIQ